MSFLNTHTWILFHNFCFFSIWKHIFIKSLINVLLISFVFWWWTNSDSCLYSTNEKYLVSTHEHRFYSYLLLWVMIEGVSQQGSVCVCVHQQCSCHLLHCMRRKRRHSVDRCWVSKHYHKLKHQNTHIHTHFPPLYNIPEYTVLPNLYLCQWMNGLQWKKKKQSPQKQLLVPYTHTHTHTHTPAWVRSSWWVWPSCRCHQRMGGWTPACSVPRLRTGLGEAPEPRESWATTQSLPLAPVGGWAGEECGRWRIPVEREGDVCWFF